MGKEIENRNLKEQKQTIAKVKPARYVKLGQMYQEKGIHINIFYKDSRTHTY